MPSPVKLYCIVSKEALDKMGGNRGKLAAQAGHAFLHAYWVSEERFPDYAKSYRSTEYAGTPQKAVKITLVAETTDQLVALDELYKDKCGTALVQDAGLTVFSEPTVTCLGIGPIIPELIGDDLKSLKVLI